MRDITFINVQVDRSLKHIMKDELMDPDDWREYVEELVINGYKTSQNYIPKYSAFSVAITGSEATPNEDKCLSFMTSSIGKGYQLIHLVETVLCDSGPWSGIDKRMDAIIDNALGR